MQAKKFILKTDENGFLIQQPQLPPNTSSDRNEPIHVHIECENKIAKVWLDPIRLQNSGGFSRSEINRILSITIEHQLNLMEAWNDYFSG